MRPPRPCGSPAAPASGGAMIPPPQTTQRVRIVVPSASVTWPGADLGDRDAEVQPHALAAEDLGDVVVRARRRTRPSSVWPRSTMWTCAAVTARSWYSAAIVVVDQVGERAGHLDAGRPAADDDEVQRALVDQRGSRSASSKTPRIRERSRCASSSEYSGKACSSAPGGAEEVRLRPGGEHEGVAAEAARRRPSSPCAPPGRATRPRRA